ncbi:MAG TPA: DUF58 domain-containing protein [Steroidobacteraceae bacterium]|nr:DUF58 domain-containing protein [Steroidobacteraceae bacterium]
MIVPDLAELLALQATARSAGLRSLRPARAHLLGAHRGVQRGRGLEFEEVRPYVAGDDARSIDWRVSARRGRLHTKLFREERERPVWLLVDLQPGMFFASRTQLKSALAVRAAALLAWITALAGDRVGAVIANGAETVWLPPRAREAGVLRIFNALLALQPRAPAAPRPHTLQSALGMLVPMVHPGSLVLAFSDFAELGEASEILWASLAAHVECRLFWITDAIERTGLPGGMFRGGVPGRLRSFDGASTRAHWLEAWRQRDARLAALAERLRMQITELDTAADLALKFAA